MSKEEYIQKMKEDIMFFAEEMKKLGVIRQETEIDLLVSVKEAINTQYRGD